MGTKFTPGPWSVEDPMGPDALWIVQANAPTSEWSCIAMVTTDEENDRDDKGRFIGRTEQEANSRLIAAAPDLYEALADLADAYESTGDRFITAARAALARARGNPSNKPTKSGV